MMGEASEGSFESYIWALIIYYMFIQKEYDGEKENDSFEEVEQQTSDYCQCNDVVSHVVLFNLKFHS